MRYAFVWVQALVLACLLPAVALTDPGAPVARTRPVAAAQDVGEQARREEQGLMDRLAQLGDAISKAPQSPDAWRYQVAQADVALALAGRGKGKEREDWLRVCVDSYYSATVLGPQNEKLPYQKLSELPGEISRVFPESTVVTYAILQGIQADYVRSLANAGENAEKVQDLHRYRLAKFAQEYPKAPEAAKALLEAGQLSETMGKNEDARRCYRYLADNFTGQPAARKAWGLLWKLGMAGEPIELKLPLLYAQDGSSHSFDMNELRNMVVVVYFWSSTGNGVSEDLVALKQLTDRHPRGVEVLFVSMDKDKKTAREFLTGRLTSGTHVFLAGGLESPIAERYGVMTVPQAYLVSKEGKLIQHSVPTSRLEALVSEHLAKNR